MNKIYKFRAWDTQTKRMYSSQDLAMVQLEELNKESSSKFMQYTGLKDSHGKEIYEGDIAKIKLQSNIIEENTSGSRNEVFTFYETGVMEFSKEYAQFGFRFNSSICYEFEKIEIEVIGNIYEQKELINV